MMNQFTLVNIIQKNNRVVLIKYIRLIYHKISSNYLNALWIVEILFVVAPIVCGSFMLLLFYILVSMPFLIQQSPC